MSSFLMVIIALTRKRRGLPGYRITLAAWVALVRLEAAVV